MKENISRNESLHFIKCHGLMTNPITYFNDSQITTWNIVFYFT